MFTKVINYIKSIFLNGLFTILPVILTASLFIFSFRLFKGWLNPINSFLPEFLQNTHAEIVIAVSFVLLIGIVLKFFFLRTIIHRIESLFFRMPLVRPVYSGIKQLVGAFSTSDKPTFKYVVLVEFPRKDIFSVAFLTSEVPKSLSPNKEDKFFSLFIPTTPNPTTGYFIISKESNFKIIDLTTQEAMALIISGGIIQPKRFE